MGVKLTVRNKRNTEENGWIKSSQYTSDIIDDIRDPSGGNIDKLLTAVPSPFARMHLFETAFIFATKNLNNLSNTIFDKMVSDCFDLFELLINYQLHKMAGENLSIKHWDFSTHLRNLSESNYLEHRMLAEVLAKYYRSNPRLKNFNPIYLFFLNNEVFGGTSPFTAFFTKPDIKNFKLKKNNGKPYFEELVPLWERDDEFLIALYRFFSPHNEELVKSAKSVFIYLERAVDLVPKDSLRNELKNILNKINFEISITFDVLRDESNSSIKILNATIPTKNPNERKTIDSTLELVSPKLPAYLEGRRPLVLIDGRDHLNQPKANLKIPRSLGDIKEINRRLLPDNNRVYPFLVADDFLEDHLVKLSYPVNHSYFLVPTFENIDRDNDNGFLLPIKKEYFDFFDLDDLKESLNIIKKNENSYVVELKIPIKNGDKVIFKKHYYDEPKQEDAGKLVKVSVFFAFFPLFKISNDNDFNDYFKIMMVDDEQTYENVILRIIDENNVEVKENPNAEKNYRRVTRNDKTKSNYGGSYYYETNFAYKFLEVNFSKGRSNQESFKGLIVPLWKEIPLGNRVFDVAIDFGTTNTHIVTLENRSTENTVPQSLTIGEDDLQIVLFNLYKKDDNLSLTEKYETWDSLLETRLISRQTHEFVPSIIGEGKNPKYKFPIRTAISTSTNYNSSNSNLLGNINISFVFEKDLVQSDEFISTNLKWEIKEADNEIKIKEFIKELLLLTRNKILLNKGNPKYSRVLWFKPLSMYPGHQSFYKRIWDELLKEIFKPHEQNEQTFCLTESCAPFFYYTAQNKVQSNKPVLSIDIGGGSTDVSFFLDNIPRFGISFNFAGNAIWNPGLKRRHETLEGIFLRYGSEFISDTIRKLQKSNKNEIDKILRIFNSIHGSGIQSENIFNLYFTWDHIIHFTDELKRDPYIKFLILFHFSAIIYHCVELLRLKGFSRPEYICVSGRGSKYISILDPTKDLHLLNEFLSGFVNDIYEVKDNYKLKLVKVDLEKEATSIGGLYLLSSSKNNNIKDTERAEPYLGETNPNFEDITYYNINYALKESVNENVKRFIKIFFSQNDKYNFDHNFTINLEEPLSNYKDYCLENSFNFLELGLNKRLENVKPTDLVNEPLFFYPIITMIYELSKRFYK
ncbi:MAG: hypothetical protein ACUVQP_04330 [Bacteroidales bacterium]